MKKAFFLLVCIVLLLTSCRGVATTGNEREQKLSAPLLFQQGSDLFCVKENNKPVKIASDFDIPSINSPDRDIIPPIDGMFRISYDYSNVAYSDPISSGQPNSLYFARTDKEDVKTISNDLSLFLGVGGTQLRNPNVFKFTTNGDLYYLRNNEETLTTDLYRYRNGKSSFVTANVVLFYISDDNKKMLCFNAQEYSEQEKLQIGDSPASTDFAVLWSYKYRTDQFTLKSIDLKTKKEEIISEKSAPNIYEYDREKLNRIQFSEQADTGRYQGKIYENGNVSDVSPTVLLPTGAQDRLWISGDIVIYLDTTANGYYLKVSEQEQQLIEKYEYDIIMINDPEKAAASEKPYIAKRRELEFVNAGDGYILYFDHELKDDDAVENLFTFWIHEGKIVDKSALDSNIEFVSAVDASFGGAVYQKQGYCYFVRDGSPVSLGENVEVLPYAIDSTLFVREKQNDNQAQGDLYGFDGRIKTKIQENISAAYYANNNLYTAISKNGKWSILHDGKILSENVTGIVADMFEMYF